MNEPEHSETWRDGHSWEFGGRFNFRVEKHGEEDGLGWSVTLPHQCDRWGIAGDEYSAEPPREALEALEAFVDEALRVRTWFRDRLLEEAR